MNDEGIISSTIHYILSILIKSQINPSTILYMTFITCSARLSPLLLSMFKVSPWPLYMLRIKLISQLCSILQWFMTDVISSHKKVMPISPAIFNLSTLTWIPKGPAALPDYLTSSCLTLLCPSRQWSLGRTYWKSPRQVLSCTPRQFSRLEGFTFPLVDHKVSPTVDWVCESTPSSPHFLSNSAS